MTLCVLQMLAALVALRCARAERHGSTPSHAGEMFYGPNLVSGLMTATGGTSTFGHLGKTMPQTFLCASQGSLLCEFLLQTYTRAGQWNQSVSSIHRLAST